jgi:DnaJ-class molecular chaperone
LDDSRISPTSSDEAGEEWEQMEVCPNCEGAAYFKLYNAETRTVTVDVCQICNGERVLAKRREWLN